MAGTFPKLRNNLESALYPFKRIISFDTGIAYNSDGTEQRYKKRAPLFLFEWTFKNISSMDAGALQAFFNNQKGMLASNWGATICGVSWSNLAFDQDSLQMRITQSDVFEIALTARQTQNKSYPYTYTSSWPTFSVGAKYQYGGLQKKFRYLTTVGQADSGPRYSYAWWANSVTNQPNRLQVGFQVDLTLSDADAAIMEAFFVGAQGRLSTFSVYDPFEDAIVTSRFDTDQLELNYQDVNRVTVSVPIIQAL